MPTGPQRTFPKNKVSTDRMNTREATIYAEYGSQCASALWDFSTDGGDETTDISFGTQLPPNSVVTAVYADTQTAATSGGSATFKIKAGSTDLTTDEALTSFDADDEQAKFTLAGSASAIKLASASELKLDIGTAAATAGKIRFTVCFHRSK
jgi:hypothetical protein